MFKIFYLFIVIFLTVNSFLSADEIALDFTEESAAGEKSASVSESLMEVPEEELVEIVGYLTALSGGVPGLELNETEIEALSEGLKKGITGEWSLEDFSQEDIQAAFAQAQARALALQEEEMDEDDEAEDDEADEAEEIDEMEAVPEIDLDALQKIGLVIFSKSGLNQLGFDAEDAAFILKGFIAGSSATGPDPLMEPKIPAFQEFIQARIDKAQATAAAEAEALLADKVATEDAFFEKLSEDTAIQKSETGLHYKIIEPGLDEKPTLEDTVLVHYKGTLIDGTKFDSSYDRGSPATFPLNGVVPGFGEGLTKIGAGGKITLYIPSDLGYGNSPRPGGVIKPGDTLIFECELIEVNPE